MNIKQQAVTKIKDLLHEIELALIATITESVKSDYEEMLYKQKLEVCDLQKRMKTL